MKNYKRIMAFGLAATMVMGSSMVVCAEAAGAVRPVMVNWKVR